MKAPLPQNYIFLVPRSPNFPGVWHVMRQIGIFQCLQNIDPLKVADKLNCIWHNEEEGGEHEKAKIIKIKSTSNLEKPLKTPQKLSKMPNNFR